MWKKCTYDFIRNPSKDTIQWEMDFMAKVFPQIDICVSILLTKDNYSLLFADLYEQFCSFPQSIDSIKIRIYKKERVVFGINSTYFDQPIIQFISFTEENLHTLLRKNPSIFRFSGDYVQLAIHPSVNIERTLNVYAQTHPDDVNNPNFDICNVEFNSLYHSILYFNKSIKLPEIQNCPLSFEVFPDIDEFLISYFMMKHCYIANVEDIISFMGDETMIVNQRIVQFCILLAKLTNCITNSPLFQFADGELQLNNLLFYDDLNIPSCEIAYQRKNEIRTSEPWKIPKYASVFDTSLQQGLQIFHSLSPGMFDRETLIDFLRCEVSCYSHGNNLNDNIDKFVEEILEKPDQSGLILRQNKYIFRDDEGFFSCS